MVEALVQLLFLSDRLEINHRHIAAAFKCAVFIEHISNAARHASRKIATRLADDDDDAARHIFATMVAGAFDHRNGARITHGETLTRDTAEIAFTIDRTIEHGIADDDRFFRHDLLGFFRRIDNQLATRQTLADIVIGFAFEFERHAMGNPGTKTLASRALQLHMHSVISQTLVAIFLGDHTREHGAR